MREKRDKMKREGANFEKELTVTHELSPSKQTQKEKQK